MCEGQLQPLPATFNNQVGMEKEAFYRSWPAFKHFLVADAVIDHYTPDDKPWQLLSVGRGRAQWWKYHDWEPLALHRPGGIESVRRRDQMLVRLAI